MYLNGKPTFTIPTQRNVGYVKSRISTPHRRTPWIIRRGHNNFCGTFYADGMHGQCRAFTSTCNVYQSPRERRAKRVRVTTRCYEASLLTVLPHRIKSSGVCPICINFKRNQHLFRRCIIAFFQGRSFANEISGPVDLPVHSSHYRRVPLGKFWHPDAKALSTAAITVRSSGIRPTHDHAIVQAVLRPPVVHWDRSSQNGVNNAGQCFAE